MKNYRFRVLFGGCFGVCVMLLYWPPLKLQLLDRTIDYVNFIPLFVTLYFQNSGLQQPFTMCVLFVSMFLQWFAIGFGLSFVMRKLRPVGAA